MGFWNSMSKKEDIIIIKRAGNCQHEKGEEGVKNCY